MNNFIEIDTYYQKCSIRKSSIIAMNLVLDITSHAPESVWTISFKLAEYPDLFSFRFFLLLTMSIVIMYIVFI